ncbi:hypothetical protein DAEQUDRAFT_560372 [Daedalea quercina L-15889]|uniref:Uncharacterized protein n=1 Tax=Daedalea quercina L-15889 TaxID=1314783 RepID=A0A165M149_9APHY|nr:hypothetical protein DAEQUDRAFT_560372 [Daedalea quercina L-15889]
MPPGPFYNWLCVAHSVCDVLSHAAHIRAAQLASAANPAGNPRNGLPREAIRRGDRGVEPVRDLDGRTFQGYGAQYVRTDFVREEPEIRSTSAGGPVVSTQPSPPVQTIDIPPAALKPHASTAPKFQVRKEVSSPLELQSPSKSPPPNVPTLNPSRQVLDTALARELSSVIGSTSEVPAHDVPIMTGTPEPAEVCRR